MRSTQDHGLSDADVLRAGMVAALQDEGVIVSAPVASAFDTVARHLFAPDEPLEAVYHPNLPLVNKRRDDGTALSSLSAAHIQAVMLEQAQVEPGMNVLEIGSGGFNAALLAELVGADGRVTSVDIDPDIVTRARIALKTAGYEQVNVVCADAEYGVREHGPYDRIIVTVASDDVPAAWIDQLVEDGRIVVPLRFAGLTRCIAFDRYSGGLASDSYRLGGFVPMQGHGAFEDHLVPINGEIGLRISQPHEELDVVALRKAVHSPRIERWSGAAFDLPDELELFLVTSEPHVPMLHVGQSLVEQGVFAPSALRGVPALVDGGSFAYRTKRANDQVGGFESGVFAHGPRAEAIAGRYVELLRTWATSYRRRGAASIEYIPSAEGTGDPTVWHETKRHGWLTVSWS